MRISTHRATHSSPASFSRTVRYDFISTSVYRVYTGLLLILLLMENTHARIGYFWHITDLHLDTIYSAQGDVLRNCWRMERQSASDNRRPGRFGDYLCDSPWSLIESAARAMKSRQGDNVEFVLWTGDGLSHSAHSLYETKKLEILRNITDLLGRTFPSQFVFPVLGHDDGANTNFRRMGELWRHWLPLEALHTFEKGGYYSIEQTKSRLRIIALNTNFMRHDPKYSQSNLAAVKQIQPNGGGSNANGMDSREYKHFYHHHGAVTQHHYYGDGSGGQFTSHFHIPRGSQFPAGIVASDGAERISALSDYENQDSEKQWAWFEDMLSKSKNNKETVYIVGHIPPGSDERHVGSQPNGHTTFTESNNMRYLALIRKYSSIIQGQFFGHLHSDSFRIIYDDKGKPVSWIMVSPSVAPRKIGIGSNNPAMRLYKFDTDSGQVLDYTQYFLDLTVANSALEPNWTPEYNLTHYYGLNDISAISLHNFVDRFTGNDGSWFAKYYRANTVRYQVGHCSGVCMLNHYCAITRVDYNEFRQCLEKEQSALHSHSPSTQSCPILILLAIVVLHWNTAFQILPWHRCFKSLRLGIIFTLRRILPGITAASQRTHQHRCYALKTNLSEDKPKKDDFNCSHLDSTNAGHHIFQLINDRTGPSSIDNTPSGAHSINVKGFKFNHELFSVISALITPNIITCQLRGEQYQRLLSFIRIPLHQQFFKCQTFFSTLVKVVRLNCHRILVGGNVLSLLISIWIVATIDTCITRVV